MASRYRPKGTIMKLTHVAILTVVLTVAFCCVWLAFANGVQTEVNSLVGQPINVSAMIQQIKNG
jgi:hypothetical protein